MTAVRRALVLLASTLSAAAAVPVPARADEVAIFRDWVRARCIAVAAGETGFAKDAAASAGAYVERGSLPAEAYEAGEAAITAALAKPLIGSVPVRFDTLKCLELAASRDIGRLARRPARR
jgi:hypothetical protein